MPATRNALAHERLRWATARRFGLTALAIATLCALLPGGVDRDAVIAAGLVAIAIGVGLWWLGREGGLLLSIATSAATLGLVVLVRMPFEPVPTPAQTYAIGFLAGGAMASVAIALVGRLAGNLASAIGFALAVAATVITASRTAEFWPVLTITVANWALAVIFGFALRQAVPRSSELIAQQAEAHNAERAASQREGQRRQSARLLHDTVLATLTLLAHSGRGVSSDALRAQAADDARLLRQLRLGGAPTPRRGSALATEPVEEGAFGQTLQSVMHRFDRVGLEVEWHTAGPLLLPPAVLDAFLLALGECLENVRRHSGVNRADVTIRDDGQTLRALVTDAGVGFHLDDVPDGHLGVKGSLQARLADVGGSARVFSAPGSGTTVVLEVPK